MHSCIYCKNGTIFSKKEHVIPQSFGLFNNNMILNDKIKQDKSVCDACNEKFGKELESYLANETIEGYIERHKHVKKKRQKGRARQKIILFLAQGPLKGLKLELDDAHKVAPLKQIALKNKQGGLEFFTLDEVKNIDVNSFRVEKNSLHAFGMDEEEAKSIFSQLGIKFEKEGDHPKPNEPALTDAISVIDKIILRAIAKIAFNYFAYHNAKEIVINKAFDSIREYVLKCTPKTRPPIKVQGKLLK